MTAILSIGQVLRRLRADFPDVSISKIRFLETEGLVTPERAPSGYRKFSEHDVERLRFVLRAQRDHYLPLKVIKDRLSAADRGLPSGLADDERAAGAMSGSAAALVDPVELVGTSEFSTRESFAADRSSGALRVTKAELLAEAGIDDAVFEQLQTYRLIPPAVAGYFGADAVTIARTAGALASYGLEPRHLRSFKMAADREVGLFEQVLVPLRQRDSEAAGAALHDLSMLSVRLHALLVRSALTGATAAR